MLPLCLISAAIGSGPRLNLAGETTLDSNPGGSSNARIRINADGTVDEITNVGGTVQVDSATDWIIPNLAATSSYDVRYTGHTGTALTAEAAAEDVWIALSADRLYGLSSSSADLSATFTLEIRAGGVTLASGSYTLTAFSAA